MALAKWWSGRPALVTGPTGLLGQWLIDALVARGARIVGLVYEPDLVDHEARIEFPMPCKVVAGDVRDGSLLRRIIADHDIRTVFHLAAQAIVETAADDPAETFDVNVRGTWEVMEACRDSTTIDSIVVASSDKAYGTSVDLPYTEEMPLLALNPYDSSKACADMIARSYAHSFGLPVAVTRCGNLYGGGDLNWSRIVPGTIRSVHHGERPVIRSDGTYLRDYLYAADAAASYLLLAEQIAANRRNIGEAFNIAAGHPIAALDLAERIVRLMGSDLECDVRDEADGEIVAQHLDATKARNALGWKPETDLDEGLTRTIDWYREHFDANPD